VERDRVKEKKKRLSVFDFRYLLGTEQRKPFSLYMRTEEKKRDNLWITRFPEPLSLSLK